MKEIQHKNFHTIRTLKPGNKVIYILASWTPNRDIWIVGCAIGLLCSKRDHFEIYLSVSKNPQLQPYSFILLD